MTRTPQNGTPAQVLDERFAQMRDETPLRTSCLHCDWLYDGTAAEGRTAALEHRLAEHPELRPTRRRRSNIQRWNPSDDGFRAGGIQRAAEVSRMVKRREHEEAV